MTFVNTYSFDDRKIYDLKTLFEGIRFIIINSILAFIFLFLTVEELEWTIFSFKEGFEDLVIDETSWNIKSFI